MCVLHACVIKRGGAKICMYKRTTHTWPCTDELESEVRVPPCTCCSAARLTGRCASAWLRRFAARTMFVNEKGKTVRLGERLGARENHREHEREIECQYEISFISQPIFIRKTNTWSFQMPNRVLHTKRKKVTWKNGCVARCVAGRSKDSNLSTNV